MKYFLQIENAMLFILTAFIYFYYFHFSWVIFLLGIFLVDLSQVGYLFNKQSGAVLYNLFHNLVLPALLLSVALLTKKDLLYMTALILFAHVWMDRMLGFGLKYGDSFQHTHLS